MCHVIMRQWQLCRAYLCWVTVGGWCPASGQTTGSIFLQCQFEAMDNILVFGGINLQTALNQIQWGQQGVSGTYISIKHRPEQKIVITYIGVGTNRIIHTTERIRSHAKWIKGHVSCAFQFYQISVWNMQMQMQRSVKLRCAVCACEGVLHMLLTARKNATKTAQQEVFVGVELAGIVAGFNGCCSGGNWTTGHELLSGWDLAQWAGEWWLARGIEQRGEQHDFHLLVFHGPKLWNDRQDKNCTLIAWLHKKNLSKVAFWAVSDNRYGWHSYIITKNWRNNEIDK